MIFFNALTTGRAGGRRHGAADPPRSPTL